MFGTRNKRAGLQSQGTMSQGAMGQDSDPSVMSRDNSLDFNIKATKTQTNTTE